MISLRKHIDSYREAEDDAALLAFRSSLLAMGACGERAIPGLGLDLNRKLVQIEQTLRESASANKVDMVSQEVEAELSQWADRALAHHSDNEREMREIIGVVAKAAESVSERDDKYARQIGELTGGLRSMASLNDLPLIRRSILESTRALQACVEKMVADGRESLIKLKSEVEEYRSRLEESERISALDPLTELANRRGFENQLEARIRAEQPFSLILMDLNGFKSVNDKYGHLAGDDLLKQFAAELRAQFGPADLVSRWGGDEFAVLVSGALQEAETRIERIEKWALGEYKITGGKQTAKVTVKASLGAVEWDGREKGVELLARADKCVYRAKERKV